jgi:hypothetical protein
MNPIAASYTRFGEGHKLRLRKGTSASTKIRAIPLLFIFVSLGLFAFYDFYALGSLQQIAGLLNPVTVSPTMAKQMNSNGSLELVLQTNSYVIRSGQR